MECRANCGACCIAPSINRPFANMPEGKKAGEPCANLDPLTYRCTIWGEAHYPQCCRDFQPAAYVCGENRDQALSLIRILERDTGD